MRIIQESFKDRPETEIISNEIIKNKSGNKREFDIIVKTVVQNIPFIIAIEFTFRVNRI